MSRAALLVLADGRFPAGGHAHSGGAEAAVKAGRITDAVSLEQFCRGRLHTSGAVAASLAAAAALGVDPRELDRAADARTPSPALRLVARRLGRQLVRAARATWPHPELDELAHQFPKGAHQPVVLGTAARAAGLGPQDAAYCALCEGVSGPATAVARLLGLDPFDATAVLARLAPALDRAAQDAVEAGRRALSDGPEALPTRSASLLEIGAEARVMLVGAMSGPLGGDHFTVSVRAARGARLRVGSAGAALALPGQDRAEARYDVRITVDDDAELLWLPEPLISARGSDLPVTTRVDLAATARLVLREEQVLGRSGEEPGRLASRLAVWIAGGCVLDQELACGPGAAEGRDGPAGLAGHCAVGQVLLVRTEFATDPPTARSWEEGAAVMPLAGPAALVTAVAPDALRLRRLLDAALASLS